MLLFIKIVISVFFLSSDARENLDEADFDLHKEEAADDEEEKAEEEADDKKDKKKDGDKDEDDDKKVTPKPQPIYKACEDETLGLKDAAEDCDKKASEGIAFCDDLTNREQCKKSCCTYHGYWLSGGKFIGVRKKEDDPREEDYIREQVTIKLQRRDSITEKLKRFDKKYKNAHELEISFSVTDSDFTDGKYKCIFRKPVPLQDHIQNIHSKSFYELTDQDLKNYKEDIEDFVWHGFGKPNTGDDGEWESTACWTRNNDLRKLKETKRCAHTCLLSVRTGEDRGRKGLSRKKSKSNPLESAKYFTLMIFTDGGDVTIELDQDTIQKYKERKQQENSITNPDCSDEIQAKEHKDYCESPGEFHWKSDYKLTEQMVDSISYKRSVDPSNEKSKAYQGIWIDSKKASFQKKCYGLNQDDPDAKPYTFLLGVVVDKAFCERHGMIRGDTDERPCIGKVLEMAYILDRIMHRELKMWIKIQDLVMPSYGHFDILLPSLEAQSNIDEKKLKETLIPNENCRGSSSAADHSLMRRTKELKNFVDTYFRNSNGQWLLFTGCPGFTRKSLFNNPPFMLKDDQTKIDYPFQINGFAYDGDLDKRGGKNKVMSGACTNTRFGAIRSTFFSKSAVNDWINLSHYFGRSIGARFPAAEHLSNLPDSENVVIPQREHLGLGDENLEPILEHKSAYEAIYQFHPSTRKHVCEVLPKQTIMFRRETFSNRLTCWAHEICDQRCADVDFPTIKEYPGTCKEMCMCAGKGRGHVVEVPKTGYQVPVGEDPETEQDMRIKLINEYQDSSPLDDKGVKTQVWDPIAGMLREREECKISDDSCTKNQTPEACMKNGFNLGCQWINPEAPEPKGKNPMPGGKCIQLDACLITCKSWAKVSNGICEPECMTDACRWDGGDCVSPQCHLSQFKDNAIIARSRVKDGICDRDLNTRNCKWDGGDCTIAPRCIDKPDCLSTLLDEMCTLQKDLKKECSRTCKTCTSTIPFGGDQLGNHEDGRKCETQCKVDEKSDLKKLKVCTIQDETVPCNTEGMDSQCKDESHNCVERIIEASIKDLKWQQSDDGKKIVELCPRTFLTCDENTKPEKKEPLKNEIGKVECEKKLEDEFEDKKEKACKDKDFKMDCQAMCSKEVEPFAPGHCGCLKLAVDQRGVMDGCESENGTKIEGKDPCSEHSNSRTCELHVEQDEETIKCEWKTNIQTQCHDDDICTETIENMIENFRSKNIDFTWDTTVKTFCMEPCHKKDGKACPSQCPAMCKICECPCKQKILGNNVCNAECNNKACNWDMGDCFQHCTVPEHEQFIGDGICQEELNNIECSFDGGDCYKDCDDSKCIKHSVDGYFQNKQCDEDCKNKACSKDFGECDESAQKGCNAEVVKAALHLRGLQIGGCGKKSEDGTIVPRDLMPFESCTPGCPSSFESSADFMCDLNDSIGFYLHHRDAACIQNIIEFLSKAECKKIKKEGECIAKHCFWKRISAKQSECKECIDLKETERCQQLIAESENGNYCKKSIAKTNCCRSCLEHKFPDHIPDPMPRPNTEGCMNYIFDEDNRKTESTNLACTERLKLISSWEHQSSNFCGIGDDEQEFMEEATENCKYLCHLGECAGRRRTCQDRVFELGEDASEYQKMEACNNSEGGEETVRIDDGLDCKWVDEIEYGLGDYWHCQPADCTLLDDEECEKSSTCSKAESKDGGCLPKAEQEKSAAEFERYIKKEFGGIKTKIKSTLELNCSCENRVVNDDISGYNYCRELKRDDSCNSYNGLLFCKNTCDNCECGKDDEDYLKCEDDPSLELDICKEAKNKNQCDWNMDLTNYVWVLVQCKKTCGFCDRCDNVTCPEGYKLIEDAAATRGWDRDTCCEEGELEQPNEDPVTDAPVDEDEDQISDEAPAEDEDPKDDDRTEDDQIPGADDRTEEEDVTSAKEDVTSAEDDVTSAKEDVTSAEDDVTSAEDDVSSAEEDRNDDEDLDNNDEPIEDDDRTEEEDDNVDPPADDEDEIKDPPADEEDEDSATNSEETVEDEDSATNSEETVEDEDSATNSEETEEDGKGKDDYEDEIEEDDDFGFDEE